MKKKVDQRIKVLIENGMKTNQRSIFLIVGDRGKDQIVNLHNLLSKLSLKGRPNVLWCFKNNLGFSSHRTKRIRQIKKQQHRGVYDKDFDKPFDLFIQSTDVRYCYYRETHKILGNTFGMLVLQDFESLTPNILCRTIETVKGGGIIVFILKTMTSLKQLYTLSMDSHKRFRTAQHQKVEPRFNERFILSLLQIDNFIAMDDELNVLPQISKKISEILPKKGNQLQDQMVGELKKLQEQLKESRIIGKLIPEAKTLDQAKALMMLMDALTQTENFTYTVSITAARGRGKSAAIGLMIAAALKLGITNVFVTAPSPENLKTLFEFVFKGLDLLGYKENSEYDIIQSDNQELKGAIMRVNIFKEHKQIIQYIKPDDYSMLSQAELLVIDEAAAIPLPIVRKLLGPYLVFMASTINGYEGTGRSLSLKLIKQLRDQNKLLFKSESFKNSSKLGRTLKEVGMSDPIRYSTNDPIEAWLNSLLLLNATQAAPLQSGLPHPKKCDLFLLNKDTLFSHHKASEMFLGKLMSLFISSHYKNSPDDLLLMSDSPGHYIFVLLGPIKEQQKNQMPDILCAVLLSLEGKIPQSLYEQGVSKAVKPSGDLIPWTISNQFQDSQFSQLAGARIIRIATHPSAVRSGYGTHTLELLQRFFKQELFDLDLEPGKVGSMEVKGSFQNTYNEGDIYTEKLKPKKGCMPLLKPVSEITPPKLDYLGTSFGLTLSLFNFWQKSGYQPVYVRQTRNNVTGEHSCIMIQPLTVQDIEVNKDVKENLTSNSTWINTYSTEFKKRFFSLLSYEFSTMNIRTSLSICHPPLTSNPNENEEENSNQIQHAELVTKVNLFDLKRLEAYAKNLIDYHLILDLVPVIARLFYLRRFHVGLKLSYAQAAILIGIGLQKKSFSEITKELKIPINQTLALFNKSMKKFVRTIKGIYEKNIEQELYVKMPKEQLKQPLKGDLMQSLKQEGQDIIKQLRKKEKTPYGMEKFEIDASEKDIIQESGERFLVKRKETVELKPRRKYKKKRKNK